MRTAVLAGTITVTVLLGGGIDAGVAGRAVYLPSRCTDQAIRPASVVPGCHQTTRQLQSLRWSRWGRPSATATGTLRTNTCVPDCPSGAGRDDAVRVTADRLRRCRGGWHQYTRLTYVSVERGAVPLRRVAFPCPG